jgi:UDP-GlcNAc3NAcA epimerase
MKRIVTIVGARPQFVKAAVLSRLFREEYGTRLTEYLVHTGQHYDATMSRVFFDEMAIPEPDINLSIGSGPHGRQTGEMLAAIEKVLVQEKPDMLLVYGDTNSTLAGALAASKLCIPVAHVEAGLRSRNMRMPEEQNRIIADHLSTYLYCPTETACVNLAREGITAGVERVGDIMYDAALFYTRWAQGRALTLPEDLPDDFYLLTLHRAENTDDHKRLAHIVEAVSGMHDLPCVFPMHPRTKNALTAAGLAFPRHVHCIEPVGYLEMLTLEQRCRFIMTDSGGVQKEAYFVAKPCITLRDETEWVETVQTGWNVLVGSDRDRITKAIHEVVVPKNRPPLFGNGDCAQRIALNLLETN